MKIPLATGQYYDNFDQHQIAKVLISEECGNQELTVRYPHVFIYIKCYVQLLHGTTDGIA
jgi:hypothetical protein